MKICPSCKRRFPEEAQHCPHDGALLISDDPYLGTVLSATYRLDRVLGEGGMGRVYEARHERLNKRYAVKVLKPEFNMQREALMRFEREAQTAGELGHVNILEVVDFNHTAEGVYYIVTEFLDGRSLGAVLKKDGPMGMQRAIPILHQMCRALGVAHTHGIVHRDLKPENVFLTRGFDTDDFVKILDFGISKVRTAESQLTQTGQIIGTPAYMAPEQAEGRADLDHRADIYSLGAMMYEMFTGKRPFQRATLQATLVALLSEPTPRLRQARPDLPQALETIILRCMARNPIERYQQISSLDGELVALWEQYVSPTLEADASRSLPGASAVSDLMSLASKDRAGPSGGRAADGELSQSPRSAVVPAGAPDAAASAPTFPQMASRPANSARNSVGIPGQPAVAQVSSPWSSAGKPVDSARTNRASDSGIGRAWLLGIIAVVLLGGIGTVGYVGYERGWLGTGPSKRSKAAGSQSHASGGQGGSEVTPGGLGAGAVVPPGDVHGQMASARRPDGRPASARSAAATHPTGMVLIHGGIFMMGRNSGGLKLERPAHRMIVKNFYLDVAEVSNRRYAAYRSHHSGQIRSPWPGGSPPAGELDLPVTNVTWKEADAYCRCVAGRRLPTEVEWEYAARSGDHKQNLYPWGATFESGKVVSSVGAAATRHLVSVRLATPYGGLFHMLGNAWEWTGSRYRPYPGSKAEDTDETLYIMRGGGAESTNPDEVTATFRAFDYPNRRPNGKRAASKYLGFRCARNALSAGGTSSP